MACNLSPLNDGVPLLEALSNALGCTVGQLTDRLNHPLYALKAHCFLMGKKLRTNYAGRDGRKHDVIYSKLSSKSAHELPAYEGFLKVTVRLVNLLSIEQVLLSLGLTLGIKLSLASAASKFYA